MFPHCSTGLGMSLIVKRLTKRYGDSVVVRDLNLEVSDGEFVSLLGPSGSGKTSTLMMIAGFTSLSGGEIRLDERSIVHLPPERRNIGVVFQNYALFPHMSAFDNVAFPLKMRKLDRSEVNSRAGSALELVRLNGLGGRFPRELSGGQQQRVAVARALVFNPKLLLMDEPLGALDKNLRAQLQLELVRLHRDLGLTILYVTHDQEEALTMSDRVALMNHGKIEQIGSPRDLYERPINRFVAEFIGESNIVLGRLEGGRLEGDSCPGSSLETRFIGDTGFAATVFVKPENASWRGRCALMIRPDKVRVFPAGGGPPKVNSGRIRSAAYAGPQTKLLVELSSGLTIAATQVNESGMRAPGVGDLVEISCSPNEAYLLSE